MSNAIVRALLAAGLTVGVVVNQPLARDSKGDPFEGIVVSGSPNGDTFYQPRPVVWPVPEILLSAFMVKSEAGMRTLVLGVVLQGVDDDVLAPLEVSIDGSTAILKLKEHPRIDTSGCVPTATQTITDDGDLVLRIARATRVQVAYDAPGHRRQSTLTSDDLGRFRRIVALYGMEPLPAAPPQTGDPLNGGLVLPSLPAGVSDPVLISSSKVEPRYPSQARTKEKNGQVVLVARILKDGTVGTLRPVSITTCGCGFAEAAMEAVRQWRYTPAMKNGQPVELDFAIVVDFVLEKSFPRVALSETPVAGHGGGGL